MFGFWSLHGGQAVVLAFCWASACFCASQCRACLTVLRTRAYCRCLFAFLVGKEVLVSDGNLASVLVPVTLWSTISFLKIAKSENGNTTKKKRVKVFGNNLYGSIHCGYYAPWEDTGLPRRTAVFLKASLLCLMCDLCQCQRAWWCTYPAQLQSWLMFCDEQGCCFLPWEAVLLHLWWVTEFVGRRARVHVALMCILSGTPSVPVSIIVTGCFIWRIWIVECICAPRHGLQPGLELHLLHWGKALPHVFSGLQSNCLVLTHTELCLQQEEVAGLLLCLRVDWRQEVSVLSLKHSHLVWTNGDGAERITLSCCTHSVCIQRALQSKGWAEPFYNGSPSERRWLESG